MLKSEHLSLRSGLVIGKMILKTQVKSSMKTVSRWLFIMALWVKSFIRSIWTMDILVGLGQKELCLLHKIKNLQMFVALELLKHI